MTNDRRATRGVIAVRTRWIVLGLLAVGLIFALTACMGQWFTQEQKATLIIGQLVLTGNRGEVLISVTNMPQEGLASIAIDNLGITYADINGASIEATGLNGFDVFAQEFISTPGRGRLVAANPNAGSESGTILKITFETNGANPSLTIEQVDVGRVTLGSHLNTFINPWDLVTNTAYYAKDVAQEGGTR